MKSDDLCLCGHIYGDHDLRERCHAQIELFVDPDAVAPKLTGSFPCPCQSFAPMGTQRLGDFFR